MFDQLLLELQDRVVSILEPNELPCTVRLICKAFAARYSGQQHTRVRLSQNVPVHAFAFRWGRPEAMGSLSGSERKQLLCLTAASGSIPNLQLLLPIVSYPIVDREICQAAASGGRLAVCQWLRQQGCPSDFNHEARKAAGRLGDRALCDWFMAADSPDDPSAVLVGAALGGHVGLVDQLLATYGPPKAPSFFLSAVASGCDLPTLHRMHAAFVTDEDEQNGQAQRTRAHIAEGAARSALPDWREKLEWLAARGCPRLDGVSAQVPGCPDAVVRLAWLEQHGWPMSPLVAVNAADGDDVETLHFALYKLRRRGGPNAQMQALDMDKRMTYGAAANGRLAALQHLHACDYSMEPAIAGAAAHGHLHVVSWLVEALGAEAVLSDRLFQWAALSSSLPLLTWLQERGCVCRDAAVIHRALLGDVSEEVLEWLLAQGCTLELTDKQFVVAAQCGDTARLAWLRRMGCPWEPDGSTFQRAMHEYGTLPALRWLVQAGCPVDWNMDWDWARDVRSESCFPVEEVEELRALQPGRVGQAGGGA